MPRKNPKETPDPIKTTTVAIKKGLSREKIIIGRLEQRQKTWRHSAAPNNPANKWVTGRKKPQPSSHPWKEGKVSQESLVFLPYLNKMNFSALMDEKDVTRILQKSDDVFTDEVKERLYSDKDKVKEILDNLIIEVPLPVTPQNAEQYIAKMKGIFVQLTLPIMQELENNPAWKKDTDADQINKMQRHLCNAYIFKILRLIHEKDGYDMANNYEKSNLIQLLIRTSTLPKQNYIDFFKNNSSSTIMNKLIEDAHTSPITRNILNNRCGFAIEPNKQDVTNNETSIPSPPKRRI